MADVDHFKSFNDTWGHELGDQVLKLIAGKLQRVGGGGRAYRYGGEEFAILFPGKDLREAWQHLEAVRQDIASYRLAIRGRDRPMELRFGEPRRGIGNIVHTVSVTVSIGVAQRDERSSTPADVLLAADRSLYRRQRERAQPGESLARIIHEQIAGESGRLPPPRRASRATPPRAGGEDLLLPASLKEASICP